MNTKIIFMFIFCLILKSSGLCFTTNDTTKNEFGITSIINSDSTLYALTSNGIYKSTNYAESWQDISYNYKTIFDNTFMLMKVFEFKGKKMLFTWSLDGTICILDFEKQEWTTVRFLNKDKLKRGEVLIDIIKSGDYFIISLYPERIYKTKDFVNWEKINEIPEGGWNIFSSNQDLIYLNDLTKEFTYIINIKDNIIQKIKTPSFIDGHFIFKDSLVFVSAKSGIYFSTNCGENWYNIAFNLKGIMEKMEFWPIVYYFEGELYCVVDNGIYKFNNENWIKCNYNWKKERFFIILVSVYDKHIVMLSQRFGLIRSDDGLNYYRANFNVENN